ncbi:MAG: hypothetical protein ACYDEY_16750 [Acidimicrobiales bacterium]
MPRPIRGNKTRGGEVGMWGARPAKTERVDPLEINRLKVVDVDVGEWSAFRHITWR